MAEVLVSALIEAKLLLGVNFASAEVVDACVEAFIGHFGDDSLRLLSRLLFKEHLQRLIHGCLIEITHYTETCQNPHYCWNKPEKVELEERARILRFLPPFTSIQGGLSGVNRKYTVGERERPALHEDVHQGYCELKKVYEW